MSEARRKKAHNRVELSEAEIAQVEALAAHGHTQADICEYLGFGERTFRDIAKRDAILLAAYNRGKINAQTFVSSRLMEYIRCPEKSASNLKAIMFYLGTQCGWSTRDEGDKDKKSEGTNRTTVILTPNAKPHYLINSKDEIKGKNNE